MAKKKFKRVLEASSTSIMDNFDVGPAAAFTALGAGVLIIAAAVIFFIKSAPPTQVTISTGPERGSFHRVAQKYAKILEANRVKVNILSSAGSSQNLERLKDPKSSVDIAMVQAGIASADGTEELISLGSISQQPLMVFYRGKPMQLLSELRDKRIAIGPEGSGSNQLAEAVLGLNGIKKDRGAKLEAMEAEAAAKAIQMGLIDAAFIMSESAAFGTLRSLTRATDIRLYSFRQADAYIRKLDYLNELNLPAGTFDLGANLPAADVALIGPTIDLLAKSSLHPAISDLLLEAAAQVHGRPGIYQKRGEFPAPHEHGVRLSDDAIRYYKSGKSFLYRMFPYWLASLLSRILVFFVPALVILVPAIRAILSFFRWRVRTKVYQRYRELLALERAILSEKDAEQRAELQKNFDRIESAIYKMKIKGSYADQIYGLRVHIDYVRRMMGQKQNA